MCLGQGLKRTAYERAYISKEYKGLVKTGLSRIIWNIICDNILRAEERERKLKERNEIKRERRSEKMKRSLRSKAPLPVTFLLSTPTEAYYPLLSLAFYPVLSLNSIFQSLNTGLEVN